MASTESQADGEIESELTLSTSDPGALSDEFRLMAQFEDPIVLVDAKGRLVWRNRAADELFAPRSSGVDVTPDRSQRSLLSYVRTPERGAAAEQIRQAALGDAQPGYAYPLNLPDQYGAALSLLVRPFVDNMNVIGLVPRSSGSEDLRDADLKLELLLYALIHGYWEWDAELNTPFFNAGWLEKLGYDERAAGLRWESLTHPDDLSELLRSLSGPINAGRCEVRLRRASGDYQWFVHHTLVVARDGTGKVRRVVGADVDISERKAAEEAQRSMQAQLARSERMANVGVLAAGVAHEINNPLAYILSNLTYAINTLRGGELDAEQHLELLEALRETRDGAERVRDIVGDLKTLSRADDKKLGPVDVRKVLASTINIAMNEVRHRAELVTDYGDVPLVKANEAQLGQVFLNLLVNAAHAIDAGGAQFNEIRVAAWGQDDFVVIEISDTGAGIASDRLDRIFDPFYTTKPVGIGTGLGLSICKNLVETLGGRIQVESSVGVGSTFRVLLPAAYAFDVEVAPSDRTPVPAHGLRVLVVDDEALVARSMRRSLPEHDVRIATSSAEALSLMKRMRFDVVLCDVMMPEMTGPELHAVVRRRDPELATRFVFVTGGAFDDETRYQLEGSRNPCLEKPFSAIQLNNVVAKAVSPRGGARD